MITVHALGNLTRDPDLKYLPSGTAVVNVGIASNERWTDSKTGEAKERVCFVDAEAWNRTAEIIAEYCTKGDQIYVRGRLQLDQWEDEETGKNRSKHKIRVDELKLIGNRNNGNSEGGKPIQKPETAPAPTQDEDIPF